MFAHESRMHTTHKIVSNSHSDLVTYSVKYSINVLIDGNYLCQLKYSLDIHHKNKQIIGGKSAVV